MGDNQDYWERVLKGIVERLIHKEDNETALRLLNCEINAEFDRDDFGYDYYEIHLIAQQPDFDSLKPQEEYLQTTINEVLNGTTRDVCNCLTICLPLPELEDGWRENLRAVIRGDKIVNQGVLVSQAPYEYRGLYFRSKTEIKIAEILDKVGLLYFPLPVACLKGKSREPDFLIRTPSGKWGILEVQGEPYHPATRADQDHARSRAFMQFGIPVQFFSSERCYRDPEGVIREFIKIVSAL